MIIGGIVFFGNQIDIFMISDKPQKYNMALFFGSLPFILIPPEYRLNKLKVTGWVLIFRLFPKSSG